MTEQDVARLIDYAAKTLPDVKVTNVSSSGDYDWETFYPVLRFRFPNGNRRLALTRELWDHRGDFEQLRQKMKFYKWVSEIEGALPGQTIILSEVGWQEPLGGEEGK